MRLNNYLLSALILITSFQVSAFDELIFAVPNFPPYALQENDVISGIGVEKVSSVLDSLGVSYKFILVANHGVALDKLRQGQVDGFFLATQNSQRDVYGTISNAVVQNDWAWFYLSDSPITPNSADFKQQAKIGTRMNTNTYIWLKDNGYQVATIPNEASTLIKMLRRKRIDAVFLASNVFWYALQKHANGGDGIAQKVQSSNPFGVYFSNAYLAKNPEFLSKFNATIATYN